jgi:hypothetical protein
LSVLEKAIIVLGGLIGVGAGPSFYHAVQHLRLPALLFGIVDLFGVLAGSVAVGLLAAPAAIGALVMLVDWIFPSQEGSEEL